MPSTIASVRTTMAHPGPADAGTPEPARSTRSLPSVLLALSALLCAAPAAAQAVYRIVGPDGKVTFSDRPPADGAPTPQALGASTGRIGSGPALPFELRQVVARFPVTLYSADNCAPCNQARSLLQNRGVPFTERTVQSSDDIESLRRISGEASLPYGTVGSQPLRGFSDVEWNQFLDAAGYPRTSQLPNGWRNAPAEPLVAVKQLPNTPLDAGTAAAAGTPATRVGNTTISERPANATPATSTQPRTPPPSNPAGIQF